MNFNNIIKSQESLVLGFLFHSLEKDIKADYQLQELHKGLQETGIRISIEKLKIIIRTLEVKNHIQEARYRGNAIEITEKGIDYYDSSFWSRLNTNQKISIIGIIIASSIALFLKFYT